MEFDETQFYADKAPFPIQILDDSSQVITTLDESASTRILDEIDIPESTNSAQPDLGGGSQDAFGQPAQQDQVLGDAPLTPEEPICDEFDESASAAGQDPSPSQPMQPIVLIDNTDFDTSGYEPLFTTTPLIGKRSRSDSPDLSDSDEKRPRVNLAAFFQAFAANQSLPGKLSISTIPPPPSDYHHLREHPYRKEFTQAMDIEFNKLLQMDAFEPISTSHIQQAHSRECGTSNQKHCPRHQVIPLRWVYDYKSDESGYVTRFKARLCVRGDIQVPDLQDTRTSTLAARTFRTLIAIITMFDLETFQMDAVNAFLNSTLEDEVYCQYPPGIGCYGKQLRLKRALYGLRIAGKRWETDIRAKLVSLRF